MDIVGAYGECKTLVCSEGQYLNFTVCVDCNETCTLCNSSETCVQCKKGLIPAYSANGTLECQECPIGYKANLDLECEGKRHNNGIEICGDGLNLGKYECDDGNLLPGDGCSPECKLEPGFVCSKVPGEPDACKDISPVEASLKVSKGNSLTITFNKLVMSLVSGTTFLLL